MWTARRVLAAAGLAEVLALATWFSATATLPALTRDWGLSGGEGAWLSGAVPAGFVAGSLLSALLNLPDRFEPGRLMALGALGAAAANLVLLAADGLVLALPARFATGLALAAVYPPGMKLVTTWFKAGRGLAVGVVVGCLTLGSASPHLVRGLADPAWRGTVVATSAFALLAALVAARLPQGPHAAPAPAVDLRYGVRALRDRPLRLATFGYLGHMWELYAFWSWVAVFAAASLGAPSRATVGVLAFAGIGLAGIAGAVGGGWLADRIGRTALTSGAMLLSGTCCLLSPLAFEAPAALLIALLLVWGAAVIADSAQFSAAATELAEPRFAGSALTLQVALGFALTIVSIRLVPVVVGAAGWRWAFLPLAAGPALGAAAMLRLRALPAAEALAGGRR
ncbi:MAG TPA: MFS transporter [Solirubrobacteraceae bacterium]|jgi:MFS family permease